MICPLYTLQDKYINKKIYVWNFNRTSILMFLKIFLRKIDIQGFVTTEEEYVGQMYMNRPVISTIQVEQEENSVLLVSDDVPKEKIASNLQSRAVYWTDALGISEQLRREQIIVYGTGSGAEKITDMLVQKGIEVGLYCVTKKDDTEQYKGKKVIEAADLERYENCSVVISVRTERYQIEILKILNGYNGRIYVENIFNQQAISQVNIIQSIDFALRKNKEIYMYGKKTAISELIEEALAVYRIRISGYVYDEEDEKQKIENVYMLALEDVQDKLLISTEILPERFVVDRENIEQAGFSLSKGNYIGFQYYTTSDEYLLSKLKSCYDPLVGVSILYQNGRPGWKVYGKEEEDRTRILILGGSTSSEIYYPENWISKLYYKLERQNIRTTIYNGAHAGNDIVDEILRFLRDGYVLRPQIVISLSGVNNTFYKESESQFNPRSVINWVKSLSHGTQYCSGIYGEESLYNFWARNIELLKLIATFYEAEFLAFLQPMNMTMEHMTLWEKSVFEMEHHVDGAENFSQSANEKSGYINLMRLFEHQNEMYMDMCHYSNQGHEIISNRVYEEILPILQSI